MNYAKEMVSRGVEVTLSWRVWIYLQGSKQFQVWEWCPDDNHAAGW